MFNFVCLIVAIILFICAALGAGPVEVGSATITLLPLGLAFLAAAFLQIPDRRS